MNNEIRTISEIDSLYAIYRLVSQRHPIDSQTRTFLNYCKKQSKDGLFSQAMIDNWCCKCENEKNNTHYNRVKEAENIIKFANERGYCCIDLNSKVKWGKTKHRLVMLDQQEMVSFFKACDEQTFYETGVFKKRGQCYELVCKAIFRLLYSNGLRPIEARLLRIEDVDLRNGIIYIRATKGYREHIVALSPEMQGILRDYDRKIRLIEPTRVAFFPDEKGEFLHRTWISDIFHKLWYKYNSTSAVPYDFRHNYAIQNINALNGLSIDEAYYSLLAISKSMGHASLNQTMYYYSLTPQYSSILNKLSSAGLKPIIHRLPDEEDRF